MKVIYNEQEKSIELNDGLKTHNLLMLFIISPGIISSVKNLYNYYIGSSQFGWSEIFYILIALVSISIIVFMVFKTSTLENIKLDQIRFLKEKKIFGKERYSLKLTNGKTRNLSTSRKESELEELRNFFSNIGVPIKKA